MRPVIVLLATGSCLLASLVNAANVEITLDDELDGILNGYCIDIAGGNENVDINKGLQAHTCYSYRGSLGTDQIFDTAHLADNELYMTDYDVCATLSGLEAGATVGLADCDGSEPQQFVFDDDGRIFAKAAPALCLTVAQDTRMGKGSQHQIKALTLESCSDELAPQQLWRTRETDD
ncbi:ricin-type beta-trefoil lectin domain protein [Granulosicoccus sp. 3-233]|uniref:ricin-type beta-trefoil lectin domain protein n=1 Tax=Granulosicoccus sp. 3-233 TaxID=3417969 RepID=UPI003D34522F